MNPKSHALSRVLQHDVDGLRVQFSAYADAFGRLTERRADIAQRFMDVFTKYHRETGRTFVAFVHQLDNTVPSDRKAYQRHRSFQAACYLKRLVDAPSTQAKHRRTTAPFDALAMVIRGVLPHVSPREGEYWGNVQRALGWRQRDMERLQRRTLAARPVPMPNMPRLARQHQRREVSIQPTGAFALSADRSAAAH